MNTEEIHVQGSLNGIAVVSSELFHRSFILYSAAQCCALQCIIPIQGKKMLSVKKIDNLIDISSNAEWLRKVIEYD